MNASDAFRRERAAEWTAERIGRMTAQEIKQLRDNAERLNEPQIVDLCTAALAGQRRTQLQGRRSRTTRTQARHLLARTKAFEARGVTLHDPRSWGGVRKTDGAVVLAIWADAVVSADGSCRYLLWAPNLAGSRPWSDLPPGRERLAHCKSAIEAGKAEGLLVYGQALEGHLPEEKAHAVHGVDAEVVLTFQVEQVGTEYWAVWGKKTAAPSMGE
jgi:hypothetical protein